MTINDAQNSTLEAYEKQLNSGNIKQAAKVLDLYERLKSIKDTGTPEPVFENNPVREIVFENESPVFENETAKTEVSEQSQPEKEFSESESNNETVFENEKPVFENKVTNENPVEAGRHWDEDINTTIEGLYFGDDFQPDDPDDEELGEAVREFIEFDSVRTKQIKQYLPRIFPDGCFIGRRDLVNDIYRHIQENNLLAWNDPTKSNGAKLICPRSILLLAKDTADPRLVSD